MSSVIRDSWNINFNDLVFKDQVGKGQFGNVYKAEYYGSEVCVKRIASDYKEDEELAKCVAREIEVLKLNHPNLVQLIGVAEMEDALYIVTEYVAKGDLHSFLMSAYEEMDWSLRVKIAYDIAAAMAFLHSKNIIHRDIKSKNIVVGENWGIKLCDFGFARRIPSNKKTSLTLRGTDQYMAPEIIFGIEYNQKADVFSYGMLLCEIITRVNIAVELERDPFDQFELNVEKFKILMPRNTPSKFAELAIRCSAYNPDHRPPFIEILKELRGILNQVSESSRQRKSVRINIDVQDMETAMPFLFPSPSKTMLTSSLVEAPTTRIQRAGSVHIPESEREVLKSSRSIDSLLLHYDHIVNGKEDIEERRERRRRISVSVGKRLLREILDNYVQ